MHNPASILENDTHESQGDFDIRTNHLISARIQDLIKILKKEKKKEKKKEIAILCNLLSKLTIE